MSTGHSAKCGIDRRAERRTAAERGWETRFLPDPALGYHLRPRTPSAALAVGLWPFLCTSETLEPALGYPFRQRTPSAALAAGLWPFLYSSETARGG